MHESVLPALPFPTPRLPLGGVSRLSIGTMEALRLACSRLVALRFSLGRRYRSRPLSFLGVRRARGYTPNLDRYAVAQSEVFRSGGAGLSQVPSRPNVNLCRALRPRAGLRHLAIPVTPMLLPASRLRKPVRSHTFRGSITRRWPSLPTLEAAIAGRLSKARLPWGANPFGPLARRGPVRRISDHVGIFPPSWTTWRDGIGIGAM